MTQARRHTEILNLLAREGEVGVEALAGRLGVSDMTIRRDLSALSRTGRLSRTHGGAVLSRTGLIAFEFRDKADLHAAGKRAVARAVAARVRPGMTLSLDTGTTTLDVARALEGLADVKVLTTSLAIASALHTREDLEVILLGGTVRRRSPDLVGPLAEDNLRRFRVDLAVVGADAITRQGTFAGDLAVARLARAMAEGAKEVVVAADSSKFDRTSFARCLPLDAIDCLVTDAECPAAVRRWLGRAVANVVYAPLSNDR